MSRYPCIRLATKYLQILGGLLGGYAREGGEGQGGIRLRLRTHESMRTLLLQI